MISFLFSNINNFYANQELNFDYCTFLFRTGSAVYFSPMATPWNEMLCSSIRLEKAN